MMGRWVALGAYTAAIYTTLPLAPQVGRAFVRSPLGAWLLGPGLAVAGAAGAITLAVVLARRGTPRWSFAALAVTIVGYGAALIWLRAQHLERIHLPEYAIAAWLAWRAVSPLCTSEVQAHVAAAALASGIGWMDELLQAVTPGRVYDLRDVGANVLGVVLGLCIVAVLNAAPSRAHVSLATRGARRG